MTTTILQTAPAAKVSQHVANVGDRVLIKGVMGKAIRYGQEYLNVFHDHDGNEFTYRSRKPIASDRVLIAMEATIGGHTEFRGVKRTEISSKREMVYSKV